MIGRINGINANGDRRRVSPFLRLLFFVVAVGLLWSPVGDALANLITELLVKAIHLVDPNRETSATWSHVYRVAVGTRSIQASSSRPLGRIG
jgi:hypothetical protein